MITPAEPRRFLFERDTLSFANELVWRYALDPATGRMAVSRNNPPPAYAHRCFVMVRTARQFFYHARFDASQPKAGAATSRKLVAEVVGRSPRRPCPEDQRVVIPGYDGLRAFSQGQQQLLKESCGAAWQSYVLRSHWRMVFPVPRRHQARMAGLLLGAVEAGRAPVVHLFRFPQLTINHGILLYGVRPTPEGLCFDAYDPNIPGAPAALHYQESDRTFRMPGNLYWGGGALNVIEVYRGWLY